MAMNISTTSAFAFGSATAGTAVQVLADFTDLNGTLVGKASRVFIQTSGTIRYRYDGGTPTAAAGHILYGATALGNNSDRLEIVGTNNINRFRIIAASGTPVVFVTLEG